MSTVERQREDCPPLRAFVEASVEANNTPAGRRLWSSVGGVPQFALCRFTGMNEAEAEAEAQRPAPVSAPSILRLLRQRNNGHGRLIDHFVYVLQTQAAAEAFLRRESLQMLSLHLSYVRQSAEMLPPESRAAFAELSGAAYGAAVSATAHGRGNRRFTGAHVVFGVGETVHLVSIAVWSRPARLEALLALTLEFSAAMAGALSRDGVAASVAGIVDRLRGALFLAVMLSGWFHGVALHDS